MDTSLKVTTSIPLHGSCYHKWTAQKEQYHHYNIIVDLPTACADKTNVRCKIMERKYSTLTQHLLLITGNYNLSLLHKPHVTRIVDWLHVGHLQILHVHHAHKHMQTAYKLLI